MSHVSEHLSSLRGEIIDLRTSNSRYSEKRKYTAVEQSALVLRTTRLVEIKQELSNMLDRPNHPAVWWDRVRNPRRAA